MGTPCWCARWSERVVVRASFVVLPYVTISSTNRLSLRCLQFKHTHQFMYDNYDQYSISASYKLRTAGYRRQLLGRYALVIFNIADRRHYPHECVHKAMHYTQLLCHWCILCDKIAPWRY